MLFVTLRPAALDVVLLLDEQRHPEQRLDPLLAQDRVEHVRAVDVLEDDRPALPDEEALRRWPVDGVPENPAAWIMTVARNRQRDVLGSAARRDTALDVEPRGVEIEVAALDRADGTVIGERSAPPGPAPALQPLKVAVAGCGVVGGGVAGENAAVVAAGMGGRVTVLDVDLERLASDLVIDGFIEADALRDELLKRLEFARNRERVFSTRRRDIPPV